MESNFQSSEIILFAGTGILIMVGLALVMVSYANRAQRRILTQQMEAQTMELQHQQDLLERNLVVQEEERQRIAAQLHDDICSKLGVLNLTFHRLSRTQPTDERYADLCMEINDLIANTLETTRRISHELVPPTLEDFGLIEALEEMLGQVRKTGMVELRFEHNVNRNDLNGESTELNLFRIVQELLNNSLKYAEATVISLRLTKNEEGLTLRYADNGKGFDHQNTLSKGLGLKNIKNRAKIIGADYQITSRRGEGFELLLKLPPRNAASSAAA